MSKDTRPLYCRVCERPVAPGEALQEGLEGILRCPRCHDVLRFDSILPGNPISIGLGLKLIGYVARLILRVGIIDALQKKADESDNTYDDFAMRIAAALIQEAAKL